MAYNEVEDIRRIGTFGEVLHEALAQSSVRKWKTDTAQAWH
jgi:hypothetical protein